MKILERKRNTEGEFFVNFFEYCNMRCSFCWQDHNSLAGAETIVERAYDILDRVKKDHRSNFIINLMGGELFADSLPDTLLGNYYEHVMILKERFPEGKTFHVNWVTNLVYSESRLNQVIELVEKCRSLVGVTSKITTSFDFSGRFNRQQKEIFRKNVVTVKPYLGTVSVVLTKPNIEKMLTDKDELFSWLYDNDYYLYFDYYSPEKNFKLNAPSESLLQKGLLFLLEKYPKVYPIQGWIKEDQNKMTCMGSMIVDNKGYRGQCRALLTKDVTEGMKSKVTLDNNVSMEEAFVNKYNCSECEFFHKCGMGCFLQHDFKGKEELNECLYKEVFRKIDAI